MAGNVTDIKVAYVTKDINGCVNYPSISCNECWTDITTLKCDTTTLFCKAYENCYGLRYSDLNSICRIEGYFCANNPQTTCTPDISFSYCFGQSCQVKCLWNYCLYHICSCKSLCTCTTTDSSVPTISGYCCYNSIENCSYKYLTSSVGCSLVCGTTTLNTSGYVYCIYDCNNTNNSYNTCAYYTDDDNYIYFCNYTNCSDDTVRSLMCGCAVIPFLTKKSVVIYYLNTCTNRLLGQYNIASWSGDCITCRCISSISPNICYVVPTVTCGNKICIIQFCFCVNNTYKCSKSYDICTCYCYKCYRCVCSYWDNCNEECCYEWDSSWTYCSEKLITSITIPAGCCCCSCINLYVYDSDYTQICNFSARATYNPVKAFVCICIYRCNNCIMSCMSGETDKLGYVLDNHNVQIITCNSFCVVNYCCPLLCSLSMPYTKASYLVYNSTGGYNCITTKITDCSKYTVINYFNATASISNGQIILTATNDNPNNSPTFTPTVYYCYCCCSKDSNTYYYCCDWYNCYYTYGNCSLAISTCGTYGTNGFRCVYQIDCCTCNYYVLCNASDKLCIDNNCTAYELPKTHCGLTTCFLTSAYECLYSDLYTNICVQ